MHYNNFIESKRQLGGNHGFKPTFMPDYLKDFQSYLIDWGVWKGRAMLAEDCGLGKTVQALVWAFNVVAHTNKPVLILTPLAVSAQTVREAEKFGIESERSFDGKFSNGAKIVVTNYERLKHFDPNDFSGCACDEASILKNFQGAFKKEITEFMKKMKYRLLLSATPAPNDFIELGTCSEALGYLGFMDMLNRFFKNDQNNTKVGRYRGETLKWRLKGHAKEPFWRFICSFMRAVRKPSDIGFSDAGYILPPLHYNEHMVEARHLAEGMLFALPAVGLREQREERKRTVEERCELSANLILKHSGKSIAWCHLNEEGDLLEKLVPNCVQVSGKDSDEAKERKLMAFIDGEVENLVTKPKIGGLGLNLQCCNHMTCFPSHSFEQFYQFVRRCWRFGQENEVYVDMVTTEGEGRIIKNVREKSDRADEMFSNLIANMNNALHIERVGNYDKKMEVPQWLR